MANLKVIRDRIKSVKSIQKVTKAMKMVAAAKMRKSQERMENSRPYSNSATEVIQHLLTDVELDLFPLLEEREIKRKAYVIVSADRGLAGAFNTNIIKIAQKEIDQFGKENIDLFCIGKKSRDHFKKRQYNIIESHIDFWADMQFDTAMMIGRSIIDHFLSGKVD
jgi:F-type H+-transporting ATPase subunit gamma